MTSPLQDVAAALAEAARTLNSPRSMEETLDTIVETAVAALPVFTHAGVSVSLPDGTLETVSGTDQLVWELDALQYSLQEGPCVDAIRDDRVVAVEHARHEQRWPDYMPRAIRMGLRSQLGIALLTEDQTLGGLNLYSTESDTIEPETVQLAELFATHAAIALGRARIEDQLNQAVASRKQIGQAIGIVMERYQISEDRAFQFLARASQTSNIKLRLVAQEVVEAANQKYEQLADD